MNLESVKNISELILKKSYNKILNTVVTRFHKNEQSSLYKQTKY